MDSTSRADSIVSSFLEPVKRFKMKSPGLEVTLLDYIVEGRDPQALMALGEDDILAIANMQKGSYSTPLSQLSGNPDLLSPSQWIRLGQVVALVPCISELSSEQPQVPSWFLAVQYLRQYWSVKAWDGDWVPRLLVESGVAPDQTTRVVLSAFFVLLSRFRYPNQLYKWRTMGATMPEFADFVLQHAQLVPDALAPLGAASRVAAAPEAELTVPPAPAPDTTPLGEEFVAAFDIAFARWLEATRKEAAANPQNGHYKESVEWGERVAPALARQFQAYLNGSGIRPEDRLSFHFWKNFKLPPLACARLCAGFYEREFDFGLFSAMVGTGHDPRTLAATIEMAGVVDAAARISGNIFGWGELRLHHPDKFWPFFAEHPDTLDQALGLIPPRIKPYDSFDDVSVSLRILKLFPTLPTKYLAPLARLATGEGKTHRRNAQELLESHTNALDIAAPTLTDRNKAVRAAGAEWIKHLGDVAGIPLLTAALEKEKSEITAAVMLNALHCLGHDISAHLTPEVLGQAAKKGLTTKPPASMAWFPLEALPPCRWADGSPVAPEVIRWWVVLACKLRDPLGAGLIPLYVSLADAPSRQTLGVFVLQAWLAQDEVSSAIADKGLLALTVGAPGHEVFELTQQYISDYGKRRAQVEALITAASGNEDEAAFDPKWKVLVR